MGYDNDLDYISKLKDDVYIYIYISKADYTNATTFVGPDL